MKRCWPCTIVLVGAALLLLGVVLFPSGEVAAATLTWTDNATNEEGTAIERVAAPCAATAPTPGFTQIGTVPVNIKTYVDNPVQGARYCYRVRAFNHEYTDGTGAIQYSPYSNEAGYNYPLAPPTAAPTQLNTTP